MMSTLAGTASDLPEMLAAAVQRQHELAVQPLAQRVLGGQVFQFGGERVVPAQRQVSVDPGLEGGEP
jgi:hypothetical protein